MDQMLANMEAYIEWAERMEIAGCIPIEAVQDHLSEIPPGWGLEPRGCYYVPPGFKLDARLN